MIVHIANLSLFLSLISIALIIYKYLYRVDSKYLDLTANLKSVSFFLLSSFALLLYAFVTSDFSLEIVLNNSHSSKPLFYKIVAVWGNHEGSFLLLVSLVSFISVLAQPYSKKYLIYKEFEFASASFLLFFVSYIVLASNPFLLAAAEYSEGFGFNPLLQDFALAIHPPLLYLGYVFCFLTFSFAIAFLLRNERMLAADFNLIFYTSLISQFFLSIGIALGSWWAYRELGWGGFWFWDPVENVSLMPWLIGLGLVHISMVARKSEVWQAFSVITALMSGYFALIGFFLVRSGVLMSVHSFASDPSRGVMLLIILTVVILCSMALYMRKSTVVFEEKVRAKTALKYDLVNFSFYLIMVVLAIIFLATIYPLIMQIFQESVVLGANYFNMSLMPVVIALIIISIVNNYITWEGRRKVSSVEKVLVVLMFVILFTLVKGYLLFSDMLVLSLTLCNLLLIASLLVAFVTSLKQKQCNISMFVGHCGFALLLVSIALFAVNKKEDNFLLEPGDEVNFLEYSITFNNYAFVTEDNYLKMTGEFRIQDRDNRIFIMHPEKRSYLSSSSETSEVDIVRDKMDDLYLVFGQFYGDAIKLRVYFNPFINFIWLSFLIIAMSFIIKPIQSLIVYLCPRKAL